MTARKDIVHGVCRNCGRQHLLWKTTLTCIAEPASKEDGTTYCQRVTAKQRRKVRTTSHHNIVKRRVRAALKRKKAKA